MQFRSHKSGGDGGVGVCSDVVVTPRGRLRPRVPLRISLGVLFSCDEAEWLKFRDYLDDHPNISSFMKIIVKSSYSNYHAACVWHRIQIVVS